MATTKSRNGKSKAAAPKKAKVEEVKETPKAIATEEIAKETEKETVSTPETYTKEQLDAAIAAAIAKAKEEIGAERRTVLQVAPDEYVSIVYIGAIANGTTVHLGRLGTLNKAGVTRDISKKDFIAGLGIPVVDALLRNRKLLVLDGLTEEERDRFGLKYESGEVLTQSAFFHILDFSPDEICEIFEKLCAEHKKTVADIVYNGYFRDNDNRINIKTIKRLNKIAKKDGGKALFAPILEDYGKKFAEDEDGE